MGLVDVLINNAGVNLDARYGYENARTTLDVNYRGVREVGDENFFLLFFFSPFCFVYYTRMTFTRNSTVLDLPLPIIPYL